MTKVKDNHSEEIRKNTLIEFLSSYKVSIEDITYTYNNYSPCSPRGFINNEQIIEVKFIAKRKLDDILSTKEEKLESKVKELEEEINKVRTRLNEAIGYYS